MGILSHSDGFPLKFVALFPFLQVVSPSIDPERGARNDGVRLVTSHRSLSLGRQPAKTAMTLDKGPDCKRRLS